MGRYCCVLQCKNKFVRDNDLHFHTFPKNRKECKSWLAILRINKTPRGISKYHVVCSEHFLPTDYKTTGTGRRLNKGAMPSVCLPIRTHDRVPKPARKSPKPRFKVPYNPIKKLNAGYSKNRWIEQDEHLKNTSQLSADLIDTDIIPGPTFDVKETQTAAQNVSIASQTIVKGCHLSSIYFHSLEESSIKYLTGFERERFNLLLCALKDDLISNDFDIYMTVPDQLVLSLFKLRHNLDYTLIGFMYHINRLVVSKIFEHVIKILYRYLKSIDFWSKKYSNQSVYTAIIDCTEIKTEKSNNPQINQDMFSHYKNTYTLKYLVAIDEKGLVIFCSRLFGGSTSDRNTIIKSGFLDKIKKDDIILADRGFYISDILEQKMVALNIPPFLRGKNQLSEAEVIETRIVANRRIHIERFIGLTKKYAILTDTFPAHLWHLADYIVFSVNMFCNFKNSIVK